MRSNNDLPLNYFIKAVRDCVGSIFLRSTETDKIPLENAVCIRQPIKTIVQNVCNFAHVVLIDFFMRMIDFDFNFVKDTFGPNEELTVRRVCTPNDRGGTVDLNAQVWGLMDCFEKTQIPCQDGVLRVFDVEVFVHDPIINTDGSGLG